MHKIRMLKTQKGVREGDIYPSTFIEGEEYDIGDELMQSFIELGVVELAADKSQGPAPANKARKAAPDDKAR